MSRNLRSSFENFWKNSGKTVKKLPGIKKKNIRRILKNDFWWLSYKFQNKLREVLDKFLRKFLRFLESIRRSSWSILMKFWESYKKLLKKIKRNWKENFKWFQKNYGNIMGKNWSNSKLILILWRNFRKISRNNFS